MKTRLLAACTFVSGLFMASCGDMDQHQLMIAYPAQGYSILFADQTVDSISFLTFDSSKIIIHNDEWIRVTGDESGTIKHDNDKRYWVTTELEFAPNTNRHSRIGAVEVQSYDYQVGARYLQFGHLDITRPSAKVETKLPNSTIPDSVSFCLADSAFILTDSLCFDVHNAWELVRKDNGEQVDWVKFDKQYGKPGRNRLIVTFEENEDTTDRSVVFELKSGRVSNDITIKQFGRKKKENE